MYAGRVACCPLVNHVENAPCALLRLEKDGTDEQMDASPLHHAYHLYNTIRLPLYNAGFVCIFYSLLPAQLS